MYEEGRGEGCCDKMTFEGRFEEVKYSMIKRKMYES